MNVVLTPKETEYMEYLDTPRTTKELMQHFDAKKSTVWQMIRTLRLDDLAHHVSNGNASYWKITEEEDNVPPIPITPLQIKYIKYLCSPHSTKEMMKELGKNQCAVQQVTRTLCRRGYVEAVGSGSSKGHGGYWKLWESTDAGREAI